MKQFFDYMKKQNPFYRLFVYSIIGVCILFDIMIIIAMIYMPFLGIKYLVVSIVFLLVLMVLYILQVGVLAYWVKNKDIFEV